MSDKQKLPSLNKIKTPKELVENIYWAFNGKIAKITIRYELKKAGLI